MSAPVESFGFIHRFIPAQERDSPLTLLLLHGTGGDETDLLGLGRQLAPAAGLLSPRGKVVENGMPRYFRRLAEGVFDLEDLQARTHELADFVETAAQRYRLASDRIFAVGFSNGANIAASVLLLRPQVLAGAVLFRPMVPLVPETMPHLRGRPVFLAAGRLDPIVRPDETEGLQRLLVQAGRMLRSIGKRRDTGSPLPTLRRLAHGCRIGRPLNAIEPRVRVSFTKLSRPLNSRPPSTPAQPDHSAFQHFVMIPISWDPTAS